MTEIAVHAPYGLPARQVANQLERCFRAEADLMRVLGGWTPLVTENDERLAFARDLGMRAEHGQVLLDRLHRLRTTDRMIALPSPQWRALVELLDAAPTVADLVAGLYLVVTADLVAAYKQLLADCDPLADELTIRLVSRHVLPDHEERLRWAESFTRGHGYDRAYFGQVRDALAAAGGLIVRSDLVPADRDDVDAGLGTGFWALPSTAPDRIELGSEYRIVGDGERASYCPPFEEFGPAEVEVLVNHHGLMPEIASLCIIGSMLHEVHDRPWEFYRDFATQCSDEVRHIGILLRRLDALGAAPDVHPFPTWTFYDAVAYLPVGERTLVFNTIVEGNVVETLHDRASALEKAGNPETAYGMDWISADESLHLHNGMRWLGEGDLTAEEIDALLSRGQALLGLVMKQKDADVKVFDSESSVLTEADFYAPRRNPIAPISRQLGGFTEEQIDKLTTSAGGRTIRR
ncbi:MAG: hypothetical protein QOJ92_649 [Frankiales bacterium]|nr:hypothetical protein [Frankiales bacterium]